MEAAQGPAFEVAHCGDAAAHDVGDAVDGVAVEVAQPNRLALRRG